MNTYYTYCLHCGNKVDPYAPNALARGLATRYHCRTCGKDYLAPRSESTGIGCDCGELVPLHAKFCGACGRPQSALFR